MATRDRLHAPPSRGRVDPNGSLVRDLAPVPPGQRPGTRNGATVVPIEGVAARLVERMNASLGVPTATSFREIRVAVLEARRTQLNVALAPRKLSYTHLIAFAVAQATAIHPSMAAAYRETDGHPQRVEPVRIGLGIAVDIERPDGSPFLVVPVIVDAPDLGFTAFAAAYDDLVDRARTARLTADDLAGGTITLTNPGTVGTTASVPRLLAGQGTIVASGAIRHHGGESLMTLSSTYDHRIIQGAESGRFLRAIDEFLQGVDGFYEYVASSLDLPELPDLPGLLDLLGLPDLPDLPGLPGLPELGEGRAAATAAAADVAAAMALVRSFRNFGHLAARLDPLGSEPPGDPSLDPAAWGLTASSLAGVPASILHVDLPGETLADVLPELRRTYCESVAFEFQHIGNHEEREWVRSVIESGEFRAQPDAVARKTLLEQLTSVEALEVFLQRAYFGQTRFSIEGVDVLVPMLDELLEQAAATGTRAVEIGMAHRGRLNVLAHVVGLPYRAILEEFEQSRPMAEGSDLPAEGMTSDVKYHRGVEGTRQTAAGPIRVTVSPNPSHLEAIDPVVEGRVRAEQTGRRVQPPKRDLLAALPVLIHGDAAFAAQGVVAETFNLARLAGYTTGGTIHLIVDNQLGFTVEPRDGRSTQYASDLAKGFDVPIVHVNADDPEACVGAIRLAVAFRERFHGDVVVDIVGYRRRGHNEEDEPAYTQPLMYERIAAHPTVRRLYLERLAADGVVEEGPAEASFEAAGAQLAEIQAELGRAVTPAVPAPDDSANAAWAAATAASAAHSGAPIPDDSPTAPRASESTPAASTQAAAAPFPPVLAPDQPSDGPAAPLTGVPAERLRAINEQLLRVPAGFTIHPNLVRQFERRRGALEAGGRIAWAHAEALALASLLNEGTPIRLTGQDTQRGTFSQRHLALFDAASGERFAPLENLGDATASFELHDSPVSEFASLGFEYGYAEQAAEALVIWEAQYGDFANEAEVIIDQFIIAGLAKWGRTSRLTLLLPHGYEGQGPEHSSARLERYLALGADDNVRVANCTTPAQYFHLLRDQAMGEPARPLILMTPKGLLRQPAASSDLEELASGGFRATIDDPERSGDRDKIHRLVLCTGRIYYDLVLSPQRASAGDVAIARVEQLYPFPTAEVGELISRYPRLESVAWTQEEPHNMGARKFVMPILRELVPPAIPVTAVSRPERASPAEGTHAAHRAEQSRIVAEALTTA